MLILRSTNRCRIFMCCINNEANLFNGSWSSEAFAVQIIPALLTAWSSKKPSPNLSECLKMLKHSDIWQFTPVNKLEDEKLEFRAMGEDGLTRVFAWLSLHINRRHKRIRWWRQKGHRLVWNAHQRRVSELVFVSSLSHLVISLKCPKLVHTHIKAA